MLQKKICVLGPTGVGKTSLIKQFVEGIFSEKYLTSIGVKIDKKIVDSSFTPVQLMLWDLEGIDKYCGFNPRYLRGASAYIIVMDQTRSASFTEAVEIFKEAQKHSDIPAVLVINKHDLTPAMSWDNNSLEDLSAAFKGSFHTSAKTGHQVEEMFHFLATMLTE
ncbi:MULTISPECIES: Rab family GTPase [Alteromonadaceae]|uniref:Rab family GTPase n=1 Tax=Brumicola blandensis TaxID=3075611 RepID=A0AAW8R540_9ALTE|nr:MULTISPECIES: Rab family GTPase [unclassified Alteromonas]MDT0583522.1 Rab family GTPase [Alteromonas sp. W409]MDT0629457.1 Rab family GTPase [Alteromonas sp. W364]